MIYFILQEFIKILLEEFKYLFFSCLKVQMILRFLLKWSFAFLRSSQLFGHLVVVEFHLKFWVVFDKSTTSLFIRCWFFSQQLRPILPTNDAFELIRGGSCCSRIRSFRSSILPEALLCLSRQVSSHLVKFMFYSSQFQPECCLNSFILIPFLSLF